MLLAAENPLLTPDWAILGGSMAFVAASVGPRPVDDPGQDGGYSPRLARHHRVSDPPAAAGAGGVQAPRDRRHRPDRLRVPRHARDRGRCQLVADRRARVRRGLLRDPAPGLVDPGHRRHVRPAGLDEPPAHPLSRGVPLALRHGDDAAVPRHVLRPARVDRAGVRLRRPHDRHRRHHGRLAARPGRHDPDAGLDRPRGAPGAEGHLLRGHGGLHQPGAVRRQPRHRLPEPDLHRRTRQLRRAGPVDDRRDPHRPGRPHRRRS